MTFYLVMFAFAALMLAFNQPLKNCAPLYGNPPDEHAHYLVPQYIYNHGTIPSGLNKEVQIPGYGGSYALYNVLPYIIMGYLMKLAGLLGASGMTRLIVARCVCVISGLIMAYVVRLTTRRLFVDDRFGWMCAFAIMFLPQHLFLHTYVNTDSMCMMAISVIIYALVAMYQDRVNAINSGILAVGIIICALTYYNAYGYILAAIILFILLGRKDMKTMFKYGIPIAIVVLLGIGWWFIRNYSLYDGDFLGLDTGKELQAKVVDADGNPVLGDTLKEQGISIIEMVRSDDYLTKLGKSFICAYGSMAIYTSVWIYRIANAGLLVGIIFYIGLAICYRQERTFNRMAFHIGMIYCILMPFILLLIYANTMDYQYQGRYLMPMLIPLMYYVIMGYNRAFQTIKDRLGERFKKKEMAVTILSIIGIMIILLVAYYVIFANAMPVYRTTGVVI